MGASKVLDLDMDFFLADCCPLADVGERPSVFGHEPWSEGDVRRFLEENCGLDAHRPIKGRLFETHDEALAFWMELIEKGELTDPFDVVHVDAHSDLGIGKPGTGFVTSRVLSLPPQKRRSLSRYYDCRQLDEANYLLFAATFRMIGTLTFVRNPRSRFDIPPEIAITDENDEYSGIFLRSPVSALFEGANGKEPMISFRVYDDYALFTDSGFAAASMARSPRYAPREADFIMEIMKDYIDCIA